MKDMQKKRNCYLLPQCQQTSKVILDYVLFFLSLCLDMPVDIPFNLNSSCINTHTPPTTSNLRAHEVMCVGNWN